jgi:hypothetical protein
MDFFRLISFFIYFLFCGDWFGLLPEVCFVFVKGAGRKSPKYNFERGIVILPTKTTAVEGSLNIAAIFAQQEQQPHNKNSNSNSNSNSNCNHAPIL